MRIKIVHYFIAFLLLITLWKCATISTPEGGPKDEAPPKLLKSVPQQNERNFKGEAIELTFNEDIKLKSKDEIIIIPSPGKETNFLVKGAKITIQPKEGWEDSTTYSISFREAIQDLSEGNPAANLRLAFSTGPLMDSLIIQGSIKETISEKIPEKVTIALYSQDTFNIFKHKPSYFTQSEKDGSFKMENLKSGTYLIYAFEDKNKNLKVDSPGEQFGFLTDTIYLVKNISNISIPLFRIDTKKLKLTSGRSIRELVTIKFNKAITSYKLIKDNGLHLDNSFGDNQTEISLFIPKEVKDSTKIRVLAHDSLYQQIDTSFYIKRTPVKRLNGKFSVSFVNPVLDSMTGKFTTTFTSNKIIKYFNTDSIFLKLDSTRIIPIDQKDIYFDTLSKKGGITKDVDRSKIYTIKKFAPKFIIGKDYACSIENDSIAGQKLPLSVKTLQETGTLLIDLKNNTKYDVIVDLLTSDGKIERTITNPKKYTFEDLPPGTYKLRFTHDKNCNGIWDYSNFFLHQEPEPIAFYQTIDSKFEFPIRANWEVGPYLITINTPPQGVKDEKPPVLLSSDPKQKETNFNKKTVELLFDEPITLLKPKEEIIITPKISDEIEISSEGKKITLQTKSNWKENTTYHIYFNESIVDTRGGNPSSNLQLTFSTGSHLDSLRLQGQVTSISGNKVPNDITVILTEQAGIKDLKNKIKYLTKTDNKGKFKLDNLLPGKYFIYAFEDKNQDQQLTTQFEPYAFLSEPINLTNSRNDIALALSTTNITKPKVEQLQVIEDLNVIKFNKPLTSYTVTTTNGLKNPYFFDSKSSEIKLYINPKVKDSTRIKLSVTDSLQQRLDTTVYIKRSKLKKPIEPVKISINKLLIDSTTSEFSSKWISNKLISQINIDRINLKVGNTIISFTASELKLDTTSNSITFKKIIPAEIIATAKTNQASILLSKDAICTFLNDSIQPQRLPIKIVTPKDFGAIQITINKKTNIDFIIQLVSSNGEIIESIKPENSYTFKNLIPGKYKLRIVTDKNQNGKWDTGNILQNQEPEKAYYFKTKEGKYEIDAKPINKAKEDILEITI